MVYENFKIHLFVIVKFHTVNQRISFLICKETALVFQHNPNTDGVGKTLESSSFLNYLRLLNTDELLMTFQIPLFRAQQPN